MKKFSFWWLLLLVPFAAGLTVTLTNTFYEAEKAVFDALRVLAPACDIPFRVITELGSAVGVIAITSIIFIASIFKKRFFNFGLPVAVTVIVSRIINITIKELINRPRPDFKTLAASEASFPSGHSQNNMALYIAVLLVTLLILKAPKYIKISKIVFIALPIIIGITRIYFGVHYVTDVLAGWGLGAFIAITVHCVYFYFYNKRRKIKNAQA